MKVIFIEDVPNIARVGQTRVVADGYARNYLLPRNLAVQANSMAAAAIDARLKKKVKQRELEEAEMAALAEKIEGVEITLKAKVGESDRLYGSITAADIAEALSKTAGREIDKRKVELAEPIKQVGESRVIIRLAHEITAAINVKVMSDEAAEEPAVAAEEKPAKAEKAEKAPKKTKAKAEVKAEAAETVAETASTSTGTSETTEKAEKKPRAKRAKKNEDAVAGPEAKPAEAEKES